MGREDRRRGSNQAGPPRGSVAMSKVADISPSRYTLADHERLELEQEEKFLTLFLADLGAAYLEHEEAKTRLAAAEDKLHRAVDMVRKREISRSQIMAKIASSRDLSDGEWAFEGTTHLVKKESSNAQ